MRYNFDFTRKDGTEVMATYRILGRGEYDDPHEIEWGKVYGLPEGEQLTEAEYEQMEAAIFENPPEYNPTEDFY
jgi:hypothetical protein